MHRASTSGAPCFTTEHAPTAAYAAPDTVIGYVPPAGICTAPAPADVTERWGDTDMSESMSDLSEEVDEYEAGCDEDASPKSTYGPLETMHTDVAASSGSSTATFVLGQEASDGEDSESDAPYSPELDTIFDALVELAGEDGRDWVPVCQIQAQTSLRLERLEELLEEWECMGVICTDDTRLKVAFCLSVADALEDEY